MNVETAVSTNLARTTLLVVVPTNIVLTTIELARHLYSVGDYMTFDNRKFRVKK